MGLEARELECEFAPGRAEPTRTISLKTVMHGGQHQRDEPVRVGQLQVWDLVNETGQDHPFHLHGFFFQIVEENGEPPPVVSWKTPSTYRARRKSGLPGYRTIVPASGCTTATSSSTTRWA